MDAKPGNGDNGLRRRLTLPLLVLYGVGVTVGAGIYVLIGATARESGVYAPVAFLVSAVVMAFTAASFSELAGRYPVSAGEAAYVEAGFGSAALSVMTGALVILAGIVSSAAIVVGSVGYIREFLPVSPVLLTCAVIVAVGLVSSWGILESVLVAALFTIIEVAGLLAVIVGGFWTTPEIVLHLPDVLPPLDDAAIWAGIGGSALLAFFAFIGFEDMVNVAEETVDPARTMPLAIGMTLGISTLLYVAVVFVAVTIVPVEDLAQSTAPLALVFEQIGGFGPEAITAIAIVATLNTVIVQVIMASRVIFGLAGRGHLPGSLGVINRRTHTPVRATVCVSVIVLVLALSFDISWLAGMTSRIALFIFILVNAALLMLKLRNREVPPGINLPAWVPAGGVLTCAALLAGDLL